LSWLTRVQNLKLLALAFQRDISGDVKFYNGSRDFDYTPLRDDFSSAGWDLLWSTYVPNLKSGSTPTMKIFKAGQNIENGVVFLWLGITQGHRQCHRLIDCIWCLVQFYTNYAPVSYCFRDSVSYLSKIADFNLLQRKHPPHISLRSMLLSRRILLSSVS